MDILTFPILQHLLHYETNLWPLPMTTFTAILVKLLHGATLSEIVTSQFRQIKLAITAQYGRIA